MGRHVRWLTPVVLAGSLFAVWGGLGVSAQTGKASHAAAPRSSHATGPLASKVAPAQPGPVSGAKTLRVSLISQNSDLVAVGPGFVAVDSPITINCPVASCTFEVDQNLQASTAVANNRWAICTQLDGSFMAEPLCPFLGKLPSDGSYQAGTFVQTATHVATGVHTVQTFIYTDFGGNRSIYAMVYRVYTP